MPCTQTHRSLLQCHWYTADEERGECTCTFVASYMNLFLLFCWRPTFYVPMHVWIPVTFWPRSTVTICMRCTVVGIIDHLFQFTHLSLVCIASMYFKWFYAMMNIDLIFFLIDLALCFAQQLLQTFNTSVREQKNK